MMNQLDKIEKRFRALFETSTAMLPWTDESDRMVHELCIAIQDLFISNVPRGQLTAPIFVISLDPQTLHRWQAQPGWEKILADVLVSSAAEFGVYFHTSPAIKLQADTTLLQNEISIDLKELPCTPRGETGVTSLGADGNSLLTGKDSVCTPILILQGDKTIRLNGPVINIGRKSTNHIIINDLRISRTHAQIRKINDDYVIFDIGSTGGTFINSNRIDQHTLRPGDVISLAGYTMIYTLDQFSAEETQKGITSEIKSTNQGEKE